MRLPFLGASAALRHLCGCLQKRPTPDWEKRAVARDDAPPFNDAPRFRGMGSRVACERDHAGEC